ncbi:hypothetical protein B0H10DRAFT_1952117 [Mycena sp. CBHHK59/15]|nr:hypothetical protein B0H10DRAFT_1952117 [Mycena sp. CBHHK59/15]
MYQNEPRHSRLQFRRGRPLAPPEIGSENHEILDRVIFDYLSKHNQPRHSRLQFRRGRPLAPPEIGSENHEILDRVIFDYLSKPYAPAYTGVVAPRLRLQKWAWDAARFLNGEIFEDLA